MNGEIEEQDKVRYLGGKTPKFQKYLRKTQKNKGIIRRAWTHIYHFECKKNMLQIPESIQLGGSLFRTCILYCDKSRCCHWNEL